MSKTHRQVVIDEVARRLALLVAPAYSTSAGRYVHDSRDPLGEPFDEKELPACWFRDTNAEIGDAGAGVDEHSLNLEIGIHDFGDRAPEIGRLIEGDLLKVIGSDKLGGLVHYLRPTGTTIEVKRETRWMVGVRVTFDLKFRTKAFDPYTFHAGPE